MARLAFYMLRKGICKKKVLLDINLLMKRGKVASKVALNNLIFHHYHHHNYRHNVSASHGGNGNCTLSISNNLELHDDSTNAPKEYEFSCKNTPLYHHYFKNKKKKYQYQQNYYYYYYYYYMSSLPKVEDNKNTGSDGLEAINKMFEDLMFNKETTTGKRQLRITDSPYPLHNEEDDHYYHVDEAAEDFIKRFYSQLKKQDY